ncbi:hypothetical protein [Streptomyces sp. NPDC054794]
MGFTPSLSKVAALWADTPVTVRLDDLDKICAAPAAWWLICGRQSR